MAFNPANLDVAVDTIGGEALRVASYYTTDSEATVRGAGYFTDAEEYGLKLETLVAVFGAEGAGTAAYTGRISSINASGHATLAIDPMPDAWAGRINVKSFTVSGVVNGAVGDGVTDDTTAIQAALTRALATGRDLYFPAGTYLVSGSGSAIFTVTKPIQIYGDGYHSIIKLAAGVPTTRDVFLYTGNADAVGYSFARFRDFRITAASAGLGRYGIALITLNNAYLFQMAVERVQIDSLSSFGVWVEDAVANTSNTLGWLRDCKITGNGFGAAVLYDSWTLDKCQFTGTGYAIDVSHIAGAGKFTVRSCNVTASSGVRLSGAIVAPTFDDNYFEALATYDGANGAYIDLAGASGALIRGAVFTNNLVTVLSSVGDPHGIRLDHADDSMIRGNTFNVIPAASYCVLTTSNADRTDYPPLENKYINSGAGCLSNSGSMTTGGWKTLHILIADSAAIADSTTLTAYDKSFVIPANYIRAGQAMRIRAAGRYSTTGTPVLTTILRVGGQTVASWGITTASGVTNGVWGVEGDLVFKTIGAAATVSRSNSRVQLGTTGVGSDLTLNTAANMTVDIQGQWSAADPANTSTLTQLLVEVCDAPTFS